MNQMQNPKRIISLAFTAATAMTAMIGAGLLFYGKNAGNETFTLAGYVVLGVSALDWALWEIFLKERLLKDKRDEDSSRQG